MDLLLIRSSSFSFRRILFILSSVCVSIFFLILDKNEIINSSYIIFLSISLISIIFLVKSGNAFHLFYPGSILAMYVLLSHGLGSWAFANEYVLPYRFYEDWTGLENLGLASFLISTSCILILFFQSYFLPINEVKKSDFVKKDINYKKIIISLFIFAFLYQFLDNLSFLGGDGSFKQIAVLYISCFLFYEFSKINSGYTRLFFSFLIIILVSIISVDDKRDAIFLMLPFLFCEMYRLNFKISLKVFIGLIIFSFFTGFLIICMSLMRGYGSYEIFSVIDLIFFAFTYIGEDFFITYFFNNIEVNYHYYHSIKSIDLIFSDKYSELISFGTTFFKSLFIFFPRDIFPFKPDSILQLYTSASDPLFREIGGSWPINLISESIWNFYFFGVLFIILISLLFNFIHEKLTVNSYIRKSLHIPLYLFLLSQWMTLFRGSGLDMFLVFIILGVFSHFLHLFVFKLIR